MITMFQSLGKSIDSMLLNLVTFMGQNLGPSLKPLLITMVSLKIIHDGYNTLFGKIQEPFGHFVLTSIKITLITAIATNWTTYFFYADAFSNKLMDGFSMALSGIKATDATIYTLIDQTFDEILTMLQLWLNNAISGSLIPSITAILTVGYCVIAAFFTVIVMTVMFSTIVLMKFGISICLMIGPIFVAAAMFEFSRNFFFSWAKVSTFHAFFGAFTVALLLASVKMLRFSAQSMFTGIEQQNANELMLYMQYGITCGVCVVLSMFSYFVINRIFEGAAPGAVAGSYGAMRQLHQLSKAVTSYLQNNQSNNQTSNKQNSVSEGSTPRSSGGSVAPSSAHTTPTQRNSSPRLSQKTKG